MNEFPRLESEHGNFYTGKIIVMPHPYMIGTKHVAHAADHFAGILSAACIEDLEEKHGPQCQWPDRRGEPRCQLSHNEHESALLIHCKIAPFIITDEGEKALPELQAFLVMLKSFPGTQEANIKGFAIDDRQWRKR